MRPETKAVLSKRLDHMKAKHARDMELLRDAIERLPPDPAPPPPPPPPVAKVRPKRPAKRPASRAHQWNRERAVAPRRPKGVQ